MGYIAKDTDYWIHSSALTFTLNALDVANYIQCTVAGGAVIQCFIPDADEVGTLGYSASHGYKSWKLQAGPTAFNNDAAKYVYVAIPRDKDANTAMVVYPSEKLDINGQNEAGQQIGNTNYYYIWLQGVISAVQGTRRSWNPEISTGKLDTAAGDAERSQSSIWYEYSAVADTVTLLKRLSMAATSWFTNIRLGSDKHNLTGVATAVTADEFMDSDELVATPSYINANYLSKKNDDTVEGNITFQKDISVSGNALVNGILTVGNWLKAKWAELAYIKSPDYTGDGAGDTGFLLTNDYNGHSRLTVDELYVRMKAIFEELQVKKETVVGGNQIFSCASNIISFTRFIHIEEIGGEITETDVSFHRVKMPVKVKGLPVFLAKLLHATNILSKSEIRRKTYTDETEFNAAVQRVRCYFLAKEGENEIENWWVGDSTNGHDLAKCQTFNLTNKYRESYVNFGGNQSPNVYWWRKVVGVSSSPVEIEGKMYHWFDVAVSDCAQNSDIPAAGDHVSQFGNDTDPERMNLISIEINGSEAPSIKLYEGINTYSITAGLYGNPMKARLSPKAGYRFSGSKFEIVTDYAIEPATIDRGNWLDIPVVNDVRICYYYDLVQHNGATWKCVASYQGSYQVDEAFTYDSHNYAVNDIIEQTTYNTLPVEQRQKCHRVQKGYTTDEPSETSPSWVIYAAKGEKGDKGDSITKASADTYRYAIGDSGITPPSSGWNPTKPSSFDKDKWLWTETTIHWSDNSTTVLYSAERNPNDGAAGQDIIVDGATVMKYYVGDSNTTHPADNSSDWKDLSQVTQTQGKWLWSQATTYYRKADSEAGSQDAGSSINYNVSYISKDGESGRGIVSVTEYYKASANATGETAPSDDSGWSTDPNLSDLTDKWDQNHKYLWNYEKVEYSSGVTVERTTPQVLAIWTKDGAAGKGIDSIQNYYKVTNSLTPPSRPSTDPTGSGSQDGWYAVPQAPTAENPYLYNYEAITWVNPAAKTYTDVQMIGHYGKDGISVRAQYSADGSSWHDTFVSTDEWMRTSTDNGTTWSTAMKIVGENGSETDFSFGISQYPTTASASTAPSDISTWSDAPMAVTTQKPYLWAKVVQKDGSGTATSTRYIRLTGDKGDKGDKGDSITKASADTYRYAIGDSGITPPSSGWNPTKPSSFDKDKWLWTETTIHWSDNSTTVLYSAERNPNDGAAGQDIIVDGATVMKYSCKDSNTIDPTTINDWADYGNVTKVKGQWLWSKATTFYRKADSAAGSHDAGSSINYNVSYIAEDGSNAQYIYLKGTARDAVTSISTNIPCEIKVNGGASLLTLNQRSLNLVTINRQTLAKVEEAHYDTYGEAAEDPNLFNNGITNLIAKLNSLDDSVFVCLVSFDAVGWSTALITALQGYGMNDIPYTGNERYPFLFIGYKNLGKGNGLTRMRNVGNYYDVVELAAYVANGGLTVKDGESGRGIVSVTEYYKASANASGETAPSDDSGWSTDPNLSDLTDKWDQNHKYLWNYEKVEYSSGVTVERTTPQVLAIWTKDGAAGKGIDSIQNYYKVTNSLTPPSRPSTDPTGSGSQDGWYAVPQAPTAENPYLYNYEAITWVNPAAKTYTDVQMIGHYGKDGISVRAQYSADGSSWHDTFVSTDEWMRTSTDNGTTWSTAMKIVGENGSETDFSFGISQYPTTASASTAPSDISTWSDAPMAVTTQKPYLWAKVVQKDGSGTATSTRYIRLTGDKGDKGDQGADGWMVTANPANVIITQALSNNTGTFSTANVSFVAKKGGNNVSIVSLSIPTGQQSLSTEFNAIIGTGTDNKKVIVSSPKTYTPQGGTVQYYTEGSFTVNVNVTDPDTNQTVTFPVTVLCYANLLGSWKEQVVGDVHTEVAESQFAFKDDNGNVVQTTRIGQYMKSSDANISTLQAATTTNLLNNAQWVPYDDDGSVTYTPATQRVKCTDAVSPTVYMEGGVQYVLSLYCNCDEGEVPSISAKNFGGDKPTDYSDDGTVTSLTGRVTIINSDTYQGDARYYVLYVPQTSGWHMFNVWDTNDNEFYRARLEAGSYPSPWGAISSEIVQTATQISASVQTSIEGKLQETGININGQTREINLIAGKVNFVDPNGDPYETPKIMIDPETGTLIAENAKITGGVFVDRVDKEYRRTWIPGSFGSGATAVPRVYKFYDVTKGNKIVELDSGGNNKYKIWKEYTLKGTTKTDYYEYYNVGKISLKSNHLFIYANGILNASNYSQSEAAKATLRIILPPPQNFVGQTLVITNKSTGFPAGTLLLEQAYIEDIHSGHEGWWNDHICMTIKELLFDSPDNPYAGALPSKYKDGEPVLTNGAWYDSAHNLQATINDTASICGIWKLHESVSGPYPEMLNSIDLDEYDWLELTAVAGDYSEWTGLTPNVVAGNLDVLDASWMITRWAKK